MRTCQALYSRGASYVLKALNFIYIDGKFDRGVLSFLSFMEAEQGRRWSYVRVIRIAGTVDSYDVAGQLAAALRHANNLRKLVLCCAESFLGMHADLAPALESLTTIEELEAHDVGSRVSALLQYAKWPLWRVRLDRIHMDDGSQSSGTTNPAFLLKNAQSTLTELVCARWLWFKEWLPTYPTYPNLRLFCISQYDDVPVSFWIQAYPNVTSLSTRLPDDFCGEMVGARLNSFMATRDNNQKCITALGKRCWQVLDQHSSSCITGLYLLAIPCRVRRIYLSRMDPRDMQFLPDVMAFARPEELEVDVYDLSLTPKLARSLQEYLKRAEDSLADLRVFHLPGVWLGGGLGSSVSDTLVSSTSSQATSEMLTERFRLRSSCPGSVIFAACAALWSARKINGLNRLGTMTARAYT